MITIQNRKTGETIQIDETNPKLLAKYGIKIPKAEGGLGMFMSGIDNSVDTGDPMITEATKAYSPNYSLEDLGINMPQQNDFTQNQPTTSADSPINFPNILSGNNDIQRMGQGIKAIVDGTNNDNPAQAAAGVAKTALAGAMGGSRFFGNINQRKIAFGQENKNTFNQIDGLFTQPYLASNVNKGSNNNPATYAEGGFKQTNNMLNSGISKFTGKKHYEGGIPINTDQPFTQANDLKINRDGANLEVENEEYYVPMAENGGAFVASDVNKLGRGGKSPAKLIELRTKEETGVSANKLTTKLSKREKFINDNKSYLSNPLLNSTSESMSLLSVPLIEQHKIIAKEEVFAQEKKKQSMGKPNDLASFQMKYGGGISKAKDGNVIKKLHDAIGITPDTPGYGTDIGKRTSIAYNNWVKDNLPEEYNETDPSDHFWNYFSPRERAETFISVYNEDWMKPLREKLELTVQPATPVNTTPTNVATPTNQTNAPVLNFNSNTVSSFPNAPTYTGINPNVDFNTLRMQETEKQRRDDFLPFAQDELPAEYNNQLGLNNIFDAFQQQTGLTIPQGSNEQRLKSLREYQNRMTPKLTEDYKRNFAKGNNAAYEEYKKSKGYKQEKDKTKESNKFFDWFKNSGKFSDDYVNKGLWGHEYYNTNKLDFETEEEYNKFLQDKDWDKVGNYWVDRSAYDASGIPGVETGMPPITYYTENKKWLNKGKEERPSDPITPNNYNTTVAEGDKKGKRSNTLIPRIGNTYPIEPIQKLSLTPYDYTPNLINPQAQINEITRGNYIGNTSGRRSEKAQEWTNDYAAIQNIMGSVANQNTQLKNQASQINNTNRQNINQLNLGYGQTFLDNIAQRNAVVTQQQMIDNNAYTKALTDQNHEASTIEYLKTAYPTEFAAMMANQPVSRLGKAKYGGKIKLKPKKKK